VLVFGRFGIRGLTTKATRPAFRAKATAKARKRQSIALVGIEHTAYTYYGATVQLVFLRGLFGLHVSTNRLDPAGSYPPFSPNPPFSNHLVVRRHGGYMIGKIGVTSPTHERCSAPAMPAKEVITGELVTQQIGPRYRAAGAA